MIFIVVKKAMVVVVVFLVSIVMGMGMVMIVFAKHRSPGQYNHQS